VIRETKLAESSKEGCGSKRDVLPMMMIMIIIIITIISLLCRPFSVKTGYKFIAWKSEWI
jgi:hypothetical protein